MHPVRISLALVLGALAVGGCTSRTLPLPPPVVNQVSAPDADGFVTVRGYALESASIGVVNERTLDGVITSSHEEGCESACAWQARIAAQASDTLRVWQFFETEGATDVLVPRPRQ